MNTTRVCWLQKAAGWRRELLNATSGLNMMSIAKWQRICAAGLVIFAHAAKKSCFCFIFRVEMWVFWIVFKVKFELHSLAIFIAKRDQHKLQMTVTKCQLPDTMSGTGQIFISGTALNARLLYLIPLSAKNGSCLILSLLFAWSLLTTNNIGRMKRSIESFVSIDNQTIDIRECGQLLDRGFHFFHFHWT